MRRSRSGRRVRDGPAFKKLKNVRRRGDHSPQEQQNQAFQDLGALHTLVGGEGEKVKVLEGERGRGPIEGSRTEDKRSRGQKVNVREANHRGLSGGPRGSPCGYNLVGGGAVWIWAQGRIIYSLQNRECKISL